MKKHCTPDVEAFTLHSEKVYCCMSIHQCPLCHAKNPQLNYEGPIRAGTFGKQTVMTFSVYVCSGCSVAFLTPAPKISYEDEVYRLEYNGSALIEHFLELHDKLQFANLAMLKDAPLRNKVIADFGCGGGALLDHVRVLAKGVIAIEPFAGYHASLRERGYHVYSRGAELLADANAPTVDIALSMDVIEHVENPVDYLREIYMTLAPDGIAYIRTPNHDDILLALNFPVFAPFYYRTVHLWYFTGKALRWAGEQAGFSRVDIRYQHNYDLSNAFAWVRDQKPTGTGRIPLFDRRIDVAWQAYLESTGQSDVVWAVMTK